MDVESGCGGEVTKLGDGPEEQTAFQVRGSIPNTPKVGPTGLLSEGGDKNKDW